MAKKRLTDPNSQSPALKGAGKVRKPPKSIPQPKHDGGSDWRNPMAGRKRKR